ADFLRTAEINDLRALADRIDLRRVSVDFSTRSTLRNWRFSIVHAQSPRHVECCAELGRNPSDGESAFPRKDRLVRKGRACKVFARPAGHRNRGASILER